MSGRAVTWAARQTVGSSTAKCVLLVLADAYNDSWGRAWPARETIAARAELDVKSVTRAIERLEDAGLIVRELWVRENGTRLGNRYYLPRFRPDVEQAAAEPGLPVVVVTEWDHKGRYMVIRASDGEVLYEGRDT